MKRVKKMDDEMYIETREILRIANQAVAKAKAENKKQGIPDTFIKNGKLYYLSADGSITTIDPRTINASK